LPGSARSPDGCRRGARRASIQQSCLEIREAFTLRPLRPLRSDPDFSTLSRSALRQEVEGGMRALTLTLVVLATVSVGAQKATVRKTDAPSSTIGKSAVPRAPDGHADVQGMWDFAQLTPFERPGDFAGREVVSEEEAETLAQKRVETSNKDRRDGGAAGDGGGACNACVWD